MSVVLEDFETVLSVTHYEEINGKREISHNLGSFRYTELHTNNDNYTE